MQSINRRVPGTWLSVLGIICGLSFAGLTKLALPVRAQEKAAKAHSARMIPDPPVIELPGFREILAKHHGKPFVVNFWATWCEPCRDEYPMLVGLAKQYAPAGLTFAGVSFDDDSDMNLVRHFLASNKPGFPNYRLKPHTDATFIRGVNSAWHGEIPSTAFYAPDGRLVAQFIGTRSRSEFERAIQELLRLSGTGGNSSSQQH